MDYARIYASFIADRRILEVDLVRSGAYVERHHIVPIALGGGNESHNLIALIPEDHLFAHLVLAKIHGGKMWAAVHAMYHLYDVRLGTKRLLGKRALYGYARRAIAAYHRDIFSGPNGPQADKVTHVLHHFDGRVARGNRFELESQTCVSRQQISAVLLGSKKNAHGWYSKQHNPDGKTRSELLSVNLRHDEVFELYHYDGSEWGGSKWEFQRKFGGRLVFQSETGDCQGWHRKKAHALDYAERLQKKCSQNAAARGSIVGEANPNLDKTLYRFLIIETGDIVEVTKLGAKQRFGVTSSGLCSLFNGRQIKTGGISLAP